MNTPEKNLGNPCFFPVLALSHLNAGRSGTMMQAIQIKQLTNHETVEPPFERCSTPNTRLKGSIQAVSRVLKGFFDLVHKLFTGGGSLARRAA